MREISEPRIWSHITDVLPDEHPLAYKSICCARCREMVHASNNECMQTWVETGKGSYCLSCFVDEVRCVLPADQAIGWTELVVYTLEDEWGLPT